MTRCDGCSTEEPSTAGRSTPKLTAPLAGVRVVELGRFVAAPFASRLLADMGADVVKVEGPGGDPFRSFTRAAPAAFASSFTALNRGKRSVAVDLGSPAGRAAVREVIAHADIFIENSRPGGMKRMGLHYEALAEMNPGLVYCSITGFGETGPYAARPGYDTIGQALSGLASQFIDPEHPRMSGPNIADSATGLMAAISVLAALRLRDATGVGQRVSTNLFGSSLALLSLETQSYLDSGRAPGPYTRPAGSLAFVSRCRDDQLLAVHLSSPPKFWSGFLTAVQRPELGDEERFSTHLRRRENYESLHVIVDEILATKPRSHWVEQFVEHGVPSAPVNGLDEALDDELVGILGLRAPVAYENGAVGESVRLPVQFGEGSVTSLAPPSRLGQHTVEVLREAGLDEEQIREGCARGELIAHP